MKNKKEKIKNIPTHILDQSIRKTVFNHKTILTLLRKKYISKFRLNYKSYEQSLKTIYIEPCYVLTEGNITQLGDLELYDIDTNKKYKIKKEKINKTFEIKFDTVYKKYYAIFNFGEENEVEKKKKYNLISLDVGLYPFLAGVTENNIFIFGENMYEEIKEILKNIDECNKKKISKKKKKKYEKKMEKRIKNLIDDMQWKLINYLTNNFNTILFGDMSAKRICMGKGISKLSKRIMIRYNLYGFKQRLQYKCKVEGVKYVEVNEYFTSKTCSVCGNIKEDLRKQKIYKCTKCKTKIHRDINGARCIYFVYRIKNKI